jgi:hypothetical protein
MHYHTVTEGGNPHREGRPSQQQRTEVGPKSEKEFGYADLDPEGWGDGGHWR